VDADETNGILYVAATSRNRLIYVNLTTGATIREVTLPGKPAIIRACPSQNRILVAYENSANIYAYTSAGAYAGTVAVSGTPWGMALNRTTSTAYAIFSNSTNMSVINCATLSASAVSLGNIPQVIASDGAATARVYYAGGLGAARGIYLISGGAETKLASLAENPEDLAYDAASNRLFAADFDDDTVTVLNAGTGAVIATVALGPQSQAPFSLRPAPQSTGLSALYILNKDTDTVSILGTTSAAVTGTISLAAEPVGLATDGSARVLYVLLNLWDLQASAPLQLQSRIRDSAGNAGTASVTLTIQPDTGGGGAPPPARIAASTAP
jgi:YVTN family beta-propeller protein